VNFLEYQPGPSDGGLRVMSHGNVVTSVSKFAYVEGYASIFPLLLSLLLKFDKAEVCLQKPVFPHFLI
jgi:hypothetical protein